MTNNMKHRLGGLLLLVLSIGFGWWGIWEPYQAALHKAPVVTYYLKVFVLVPAALVAGFYFLTFGDALPYRDVDKKQLTPAGWILMALISVVSAASFFWLQGQFKALGYAAG